MTIMNRNNDQQATLFIATLPLPMYVGDYRVRKLSAEDAARLIRDCFDSDDWQVVSGVHAGTTASLLTNMSGRVIRRYDRPKLPPPEPGDRFLYVRLASGIQRETPIQQLSILDVEFMVIDYTQAIDQ